MASSQIEQKTKSFKVSLIIILFLGCSHFCSAKRFYFSSTIGNDSYPFVNAQDSLTPWNTLSKLNDLYFQLLPGDSVLFRKGDTWIGTLTPKCNGIIFSSYGSGALPIIDGGKELALSIISVYQKDITVDNLSFKRTGAKDIVAQLGNSWSTMYPGLTNSNFTRCYFHGGIKVTGSYNLFGNNTVNGASNNGNGNGIWEHHESSHHNRYIGNEISNFSLRGIWSMIRTHDSVFENNIIYDCKLSAIDLDGAFYLVYGHTIKNNTIYNIEIDAIELENAFDCLVSNNYLYGGGHAYIYAINYDKCEIMNGHGAENGLGAILNTTIVGNLMIGGGVDYTSVAIGIHKAGGINVYNNSIYNFKSRFFDLDYNNRSEVPMIKLVNNVFSTIESPSWYAMINFSTNDLDILAEDDYNCFFNNGGKDIYSERGSHKQLTLDDYRKRTGKGIHSISVNPQFVSTKDLHLAESSPCIDVGKNIGLPFIGKSPDMGAYEYMCSSDATSMILNPVLIDSSNSDRWVSLINTEGTTVAEIKANGNILGKIQAFSYRHEGPSREDNQGRLFLNRDITIIPENALVGSNPVNLRLYVSEEEFRALSSATGTLSPGKSSDLKIFKSNINVCSELSSERILNLYSTIDKQGKDYVLNSAVTSLATFYISLAPVSSLPVKVISFEAFGEKQFSILRWQVAAEENFSYYEIQKTFDGKDFKQIGKIDKAADNDSGAYSFYDLAFSTYPAGVVYYRLKLVDSDGSYAMSRMVSLTVNSVGNPPKLYPNPAKEKISINTDEKSEMTWQIVDNSGGIYLTGKSNIPSFEIKLSGLVTGIYFLKVQSGQNDATLKFLKE